MGEQEQQQAQQTDNPLYTTPDVYQTQTGQDIYQTPEVDAGHHDTGGMFSGEQPQSIYGNPAFDAGQNRIDNTTYSGGQYGGDSYGNARYDHNPYSNDAAQSGDAGNTQQEMNPYDSGQYNNQYGKNQYGKNQYANGQNSANQYANSPYGGNQYGNNQYGNNQYGYNAYSPYAMPPAKKHTGLIIGIIITVAILFLIALFALFYNAYEAVSDRPAESEPKHMVAFYNEFFGDYWFVDHINDAEYLEEFYNKYFGDEWYEEHLKELENSAPDGDDDISADDHRDDYDHDYDYGYGDDYDYDDYDDDEYYTLHDDIRRDLSYSIEWDYYEYEPDDKDVMILVDYPVVVGSHVPNLDKINEAIADEISVFTDYYEEEYSNYMYDEDSYFYASATGYVTYMSEDVLSVVYSEYVYSDYYDSVFCYSINIDMHNGVILDNTDIIAVDDDFSVDFRYRSEEQNGSIDTIDWMSDQEITELLTSSGNLIIFYVPQGMEIGFNYEDGWVTVTYHDYKDYLKIF